MNHNVSYVYNAGFEECRIDGESIENFFEKNSSVHEHIRRNILLATRNFQFRVQTFISKIVHNKMSEMKVKYHSFRTEFQMRGRYREIFGNVLIVNNYVYHNIQVLLIFMESYSWI